MHGIPCFLFHRTIKDRSSHAEIPDKAHGPVVGHGRCICCRDPVIGHNSFTVKRGGCQGFYVWTIGNVAAVLCWNTKTPVLIRIDPDLCNKRLHIRIHDVFCEIRSGGWTTNALDFMAAFAGVDFFLMASFVTVVPACPF